MKKAPKRIVLAVWVLLGFLFVAAAGAQVGSSSRDRMMRPIGPSAPGSKGQQEPQQEERAVQRGTWLRGDDRQQEQLLGCFRLASVLVQHTRDIRKAASAGVVDWKEVAGQFEDLQRGVSLLSERHEQFALDLNNGQRSWWEKSLQEIMSIQLLLSERMGAIDRDIRGEKPETVPVMKAFTDLEGQFRRWNDTYGRIAADMGLQIEQPRSASGAIRGIPGAQGPGR